MMRNLHPLEFDNLSNFITNQGLKYATGFNHPKFIKCLVESGVGKAYCTTGENFFGLIIIKKRGPFLGLYTLPFNTPGGILTFDIGGISLNLDIPLYVYRVRIVDFHNLVEKCNLKSKMVYTHILNLLPGYGEVFENYSQTLRRILRKKELLVEQLTENDLDRFFDLHQRTMKRLNVLPKPYSLIRKIFQSDKKREFSEFLIAKTPKAGKVIAGILFIKSKVMWSAWIEGYDPSYLDLNPIEHILDYAIRKASEDSVKLFNLGPDPPLRDGVGKFKEKFGGKLYPYRVYFYDSFYLRLLNLKRDI